MIKIALSFSIILLLGGCSIKTPPNQWEYKAKNSTESYMKNYLSNKDTLAKSDYERAVEHAKSSADLSMLGKIYLTKCAMETVVGKSAQCQEFQELELILNDQQLSSYKNFVLKNFNDVHIELLPLKYQPFSRYYLEKNYSASIKQLQENKDVVSVLLMGVLIQEYLGIEDIDRIITLSSFYGYTKATKYWLEYKSSKFKDDRSEKILKILEN